MIQQILSQRLVEALGWTLVHALWQAAIFALGLGLTLLLLRKYSARARYNVSIGILAAFFLTAMLSFTQLYRNGAAYNSAEDNNADVSIVQPKPSNDTSYPTENPLQNEISANAEDVGLIATESLPTEITKPSIIKRIGIYYDQHLPLIVTLWLLGVLILQLRFLGQLAYLQRLKNYGTERFPKRFAPMLQELETKMKLTKPIRYLSSFRIDSPFTAGWLRPVILFPATLLDQLKEPELRTIIAHELAHVRRHDFLVNLTQTLLCILFFYHPAVWWMSARIEEEREHCCDDLAIEVTGARVGYAKALLQLKENEINSALAMNLLGKQGFKQRVTRLLSGYLGTGTYHEGFVSALILCGILATAVGLSGQASTSASSLASANQKMTERETPQEKLKGKTDHYSRAVFESATEAETLISRQTSPEEIATSTNDSTVFFYLLRAIDDGNIPLVSYFLDQGVELNKEDENGWFPLAVAVSEHRPEVLQLLLDRGADVNYINHRGYTALIEAADEGSYECAKILLERGADKELKGPGFRRTAMDMAASEGHQDIMDLLLGRGATIQSADRSTTSLHEAAEEGNINVVNFLIKSGVSAGIIDGNGRTPLSLAAEEGHPRVVEYLLQNGANPNDADDELRTALSYAAEEGNDDCVRILLQYGASHRGKDASGRTPLDYAVHEITDLTLESVGDDLDSRRYNPGKVISWADDGDGLDEIIRLLAKQGALADGLSVSPDGTVTIKPDELQREFQRYPDEIMPGDFDNQKHDGDHDHNGGDSHFDVNIDDPKNSLVDLVFAGDILALRNQLNKGADPDEHGRDNYTPLTMATRENNLRAARVLLEAGADIYHPDHNGLTALDIALRDNLLDFLRLLNENGASVTALDFHGHSPLENAARDGHSEVLRYLLKEGADPNGGRGPSPLFFAAREDMAESVRILLKYGANIDSRCDNRDTDYFGRFYQGDKWTIALYSNVTPLMAAITDQSEAAIAVLLKSGANVKATCHKTRYFASQKISWRDAENLTPAILEERFQKAYQIQDWTPLLEAVESGNPKLVQILLQAGADKNYQAQNGMTARSLARELGNQTIIDLLN